ncbi:MAG: CARDB domain-containing protein [Candidatus Altiarchaeota archaeon]
MLAPAAQAAALSSSSSGTSDVAATNMVVDFTSTPTSASARPGDSMIFNLAIKNSGGQKAEDVQVWLLSTGIVRSDKKFYIGRIDPSETKTIPVIVSINPTARTGLTALQIKINYNGYRSDGASNDNQLTTWEIPFTIMGNPLFQVTPGKTTYYMDNLDDLSLTVLAKDSVKDLEATLSSNCVTVIGSSRNYVGDVGENQNFNLAYSIKPSTSGACMAALGLSYTDDVGTKVSDNVTIGLNVQDQGVDFKIANVSYTPTGPGEQTDLAVVLKNVGEAKAGGVTLSLNLTAPFAPVDSAERYIQTVPANGEVEVTFKVSVGWDAATQAYSIPLNIDYKVGGTSYSVRKDIGLDVAGKITLEVMQVQTSGGSVRIDVANIGTRTADGVKATLIIPNAQNRTGTGGFGGNATRGQAGGGQRQFNNSGQGMDADSTRLISYKANIMSTKQTTFTFATSATGPATLELEYNGLNNQRVTQTERITLGTSSGGTSSRTTSTNGTSYTNYAYAAAALAILYLAYRKYKGKKK